MRPAPAAARGLLTLAPALALALLAAADGTRPQGNVEVSVLPASALQRRGLRAREAGAARGPPGTAALETAPPSGLSREQRMEQVLARAEEAEVQKVKKDFEGVPEGDSQDSEHDEEQHDEVQNEHDEDAAQRIEEEIDEEQADEVQAPWPKIKPCSWYWIPEEHDMTPYNAFYAIQAFLRERRSQCWGWHYADTFAVKHKKHGFTALQDFLAAVPEDELHWPRWRITLVCQGGLSGFVHSLGLDWHTRYNVTTDQHPVLGFHVWHRLEIPEEHKLVKETVKQMREEYSYMWNNMRKKILEVAPGGDDEKIRGPPRGGAPGLYRERLAKHREKEVMEAARERRKELELEKLSEVEEPDSEPEGPILDGRGPPKLKNGGLDAKDMELLGALDSQRLNHNALTAAEQREIVDEVVDSGLERDTQREEQAGGGT